jgi:4-hydroxy-tetrahydrodipicolinate synthase
MLIPCGTTGEASTLTEAETQRVIEITIEVAAGRAPSSPAAPTTPPPRPSSTPSASRRSPISPASSPRIPTTTAPTRKASSNTSAPSPKPSTCPSCSTTSLAAPRRTSFPKPFSASPRFPTSSASRNPRRHGPDHRAPHPRSATFSVLAGDDALALPVIALGGTGLISVASNAIPGPMSQMIAAALSGDWPAARALNSRYFALMQAHFIEPSPAPIKATLALLGRCTETSASPWSPSPKPPAAKLESLLRGLNLLFASNKPFCIHRPLQST